MAGTLGSRCLVPGSEKTRHVKPGTCRVSGQRDVPRAEQAVEVIDPVAKDVHVQMADPRRVRHDEPTECREAAAALACVLHVDRAGEVERHGEGAVRETVCRWLVVGFADDGSEGRRGQRNVPPPLVDVRRGDDGGTAAKEAEYVEELGGSRLIGCSLPCRTSTCSRMLSRRDSIVAATVAAAMRGAARGTVRGAARGTVR